MTDALFNTLLAVAAMCGQHMHAGSQVIPDRAPLVIVPSTVYDKGFEQCAAVAKAIDAETDRRNKAAKAIQDAEDTKRLKNALAGLNGKKFSPEAAPWHFSQESTCVMPTTIETLTGEGKLIIGELK